MAYPSTIATLTNPLATDKLNSPSHSTIETNQNTEVVAIETFVGTLSSVVGTLTYDVRGANSNGGGHVQTANKGGTGQTSYAKGDILIASSASVLSKLAIGADNFGLIADSTQSSGVKWSGVATSQAIQNEQYSYAPGSVISASVYAAEISPAPQASVAGQIFAIKFPTTNVNSVMALTVSSIAAQRIKNTDGTNLVAGNIQASMIGLVANDAGSFQLLNPFKSSVPAWVDEGTLTWAAEIVDKTLTLTNTGQNLYAIYINFTSGSGNTLQMQINADTNTHYNYTTMTGTALSNTTGQTSFEIAQSTGRLTGGVIYLTGTALSTNNPTISASIGQNGTNRVLLSGYFSTTPASLTSITFLVNGGTGTITGKVHVYSLAF